ncbi:MAG: hypothetical protein ACFFG0_11445 [Candidatus Thorarchaeota archaeon]
MVKITDIYDVFEHPFLSEVILELRFPTRLRILEYIADFQDKIIEEFSKLNDGFLIKFTLIPEEIPPMQTEKFSRIAEWAPNMKPIKNN